MDSPDWNDIFTPAELAAALRLHGLKLAKMHGCYGMAEDILHAASAIEDLADDREQYKSAGGELVRQILGAKESLTRKPS
jgi:hypothetical protein